MCEANINCISARCRRDLRYNLLCTSFWGEKPRAQSAENVNRENFCDQPACKTRKSRNFGRLQHEEVQTLRIQGRLVYG